MTTLEHYAEINPPLAEIDRSSEQSVAFVPMAAVSEEGRLVGKETRPISSVAKGYSCFRRNDVLLAKITPCFENGKAALLDALCTDVGFGSTEFHVLRARDGVDPRFVFYLVWNHRFREEAAKHMTGSAGQKRIPSSYLRQVEVPFLDSANQRRVADILDKAAAIGSKRGEAIALTEQLLRSAFLDIFGDPVANPKQWPLEPLSVLADVNRGKFSPRPRNDPRFYGGAFPFIQTGDLRNATGYLREWKQTLNHEGTAVSRRFDRGTVAIAIAANIGDTAIVDFDFYCPDSVVGIVPRASMATSEYLELMLRFFQPRLLADAPETAQKNINLETLRPLMVPAPPKSVQERFGELYREVYAVSDRVRRSLTESSDLFGSLIQRAFAGQLSDKATC